MNNLGAISTRYFECGVHKGGLFCSAIRNNPNLLMATANDSFASDETNEDKAWPQFVSNGGKCKSDKTEFAVIVGDTFEVDPSIIVGPIDLYLFDADHSYESQRKAMSHFLPAMADEFIVCVDDYDWREVSEGTQQGLFEIRSQYEILFEHMFIGNDHDNDGFWNGFYVALLRKKKEKKTKKK